MRTLRKLEKLPLELGVGGSVTKQLREAKRHRMESGAKPIGAQLYKNKPDQPRTKQDN